MVVSGEFNKARGRSVLTEVLGILAQVGIVEIGLADDNCEVSVSDRWSDGGLAGGSVPCFSSYFSFVS